MNLQKTVKSTEFYVALIILLLCMAIQVKSGQFFTGNNLVDVVRAFLVPAMFCIGEMFIIITGGVDVSFPAIASLSMFVVCSQLEDVASNPLVFFGVAMFIGLMVGILNGVIIARFKFPALIVTLGTSSICFGIMQGVFKSREYPLCAPLKELGEMKLFSATNPVSGLTSNMPIGFILMILLIFLGWFILNRTMLGRGIYAIGGDVKAAQRAGFNVFGILLFIYAFSGCMAGLIGILRSTMLLAVHPNNLEGMEMTVIAACVLGGVRMTGGKGSVLGAMLGMALLTIVDNSLILLGISTVWQKVFTGAIIIIGTAASAIQAKRNERKLAIKMSEGGNWYGYNQTCNK
ncbi:ABC-type transporter, integral membrane subunit [Pelosinus sp. UFO1]|nr:ABC-type transporter, integral membrane subunit [Pelosinus sp. UFO1]